MRGSIDTLGKRVRMTQARGQLSPAPSVAKWLSNTASTMAWSVDGVGCCLSWPTRRVSGLLIPSVCYFAGQVPEDRSHSQFIKQWLLLSVSNLLHSRRRAERFRSGIAGSFLWPTMCVL